MTTKTGVPEMAPATGNDMIDRDHADFERLLASVQRLDDAGLAAGLADLRRHMADHFGREQELMRTSGFPMRMVHRNEHQRVLAWVDAVAVRHERGDGAGVRRFLDTELPQWFVQHAATMDMATANWVRTGELGF